MICSSGTALRAAAWTTERHKSAAVCDGVPEDRTDVGGPHHLQQRVDRHAGPRNHEGVLIQQTMKEDLQPGIKLRAVSQQPTLWDIRARLPDSPGQRTPAVEDWFGAAAATGSENREPRPLEIDVGCVCAGQVGVG